MQKYTEDKNLMNFVVDLGEFWILFKRRNSAGVLGLQFRNLRRSLKSCPRSAYDTLRTQHVATKTDVKANEFNPVKRKTEGCCRNIYLVQT